MRAPGLLARTERGFEALPQRGGEAEVLRGRCRVFVVVHGLFGLDKLLDRVEAKIPNTERRLLGWLGGRPTAVLVSRSVVLDSPAMVGRWVCRRLGRELFARVDQWYYRTGAVVPTTGLVDRFAGFPEDEVTRRVGAFARRLARPGRYWDGRRFVFEGQCPSGHRAGVVDWPGRGEMQVRCSQGCRYTV